MEELTCWGMETILDLTNCNPEIISNPDEIQLYAEELVALLDMEAYGEPIIAHFGKEDKLGYTLVQLIQTSNITAHFSEDTHAAYINIFSCKSYDPQTVESFTTEFFEAESTNMTVLKRGTK